MAGRINNTKPAAVESLVTAGDCGRGRGVRWGAVSHAASEVASARAEHKQVPPQALGHSGETWRCGLITHLCCDEEADLQRAAGGMQHPGALVCQPRPHCLPRR